MVFFRAQCKGYSFEKMQSHSSGDGGDGYGEFGGLCASKYANGYHHSGYGDQFGGCLPALDDDDEVVVFKGRIIVEIYDGYRVEPIAEIARFTVAQWLDMIDSGEAEEFED